MTLRNALVLACLFNSAFAAQASDRLILSEGNWDLRRSEDQSSSAQSCVLRPKTPSRIQVTHDRMDVTGMPKNSVFNFQYRIDDGPASTPRFPSEAMQTAGSITIEGDDFRALVGGRRFRIRILDRWHEAITEDVDLTGLKEVYAQMTDQCK